MKFRGINPGLDRDDARHLNDFLFQLEPLLQLECTAPLLYTRDLGGLAISVDIPNNPYNYSPGGGTPPYDPTYPATQVSGTGPPTWTPLTGTYPMTWNPTDGALYIYTGTVWTLPIANPPPAITTTYNFGTSNTASVSPPGKLSPPTLTTAGPPTWTPISGTYPIEFSSTENTLYQWNGTTWQGLTGNNVSISTIFKSNVAIYDTGVQVFVYNQGTNTFTFSNKVEIDDSDVTYVNTSNVFYEYKTSTNTTTYTDTNLKIVNSTNVVYQYNTTTNTFTYADSTTINISDTVITNYNNTTVTNYLDTSTLMMSTTATLIIPVGSTPPSTTPTQGSLVTDLTNIFVGEGSTWNYIPTFPAATTLTTNQIFVTDTNTPPGLQPVTNNSTSTLMFLTQISGNLPTFTTISVGDLPTMVGATSMTNGTGGAVPQPVAGDDVKFLKGDATWASISPAAAGPDLAVQYNDDGFLGGSADFNYDDTIGQLTIGGSTKDGVIELANSDSSKQASLHCDHLKMDAGTLFAFGDGSADYFTIDTSNGWTAFGKPPNFTSGIKVGGTSGMTGGIIIGLTTYNFVDGVWLSTTP